MYAPRVLFMHGDVLVCRQTTNDFDGNENHLCFPSSSRKRMKFELFPKQGLLIILSYCHVTAVSQDMNGCLLDPGMSSCRYISYMIYIIIVLSWSSCHCVTRHEWVLIRPNDVAVSKPLDRPEISSQQDDKYDNWWWWWLWWCID